MKKVIIDLNSKEPMTSDERIEKIVEGFQKELSTGPIIGEAKSLVYALARNLFMRDEILYSMGMTLKRREEMFKGYTKVAAKHDKEVLKRREKKK